MAASSPTSARKWSSSARNNATIHKLNECVAVADIEPLKEIYRLTLVNLLA